MSLFGENKGGPQITQSNADFTQIRSEKISEAPVGCLRAWERETRVSRSSSTFGTGADLKWEAMILAETGLSDCWRVWGRALNWSGRLLSQGILDFRFGEGGGEVEG